MDPILPLLSSYIYHTYLTLSLVAPYPIFPDLMSLYKIYTKDYLIIISTKITRDWVYLLATKDG